jgi:RNA polymerase sigma-70 factor (ECF subfamily)
VSEAAHALDAVLAAGQAAHPGVVVEREVLAGYLGARPEAESRHGADLYLACACLVGARHAADAFMTRYLASLPHWLGRLARSPDFVAEVRQLLATKLLVGDGEKPPQIGEYSGRGALEGWVRIAATRTALNLQRGDKRQAAFTEAVENRLVNEDGDLSMLKQSIREPFRRALTDAAAALARPHRMLLRLHYVEGMTTAQLASLQEVSRATIIRRVADACEALLDDVHRRLAAALKIDEEEMGEMFRLVRSQLDVSLVRLLRQTLS